MSLLEAPNKGASTVGSLDVGHPVDIIHIKYEHDVKWYKVSSQLTKAIGYILEKEVEPMAKVMTD